MLDIGQVPSRLIEPSEKEPIKISDRGPSSKLRTVRVALTFFRLTARLVALKFAGTLEPRRAGRMVRESMQNLGVIWIKIGQFMSTRVDLFSLEFCSEMMRLLDRADAFPFELVRERVESELGVPLESVFDEFDEHPFAAASIGQVHRARLRQEGVVVAVKVQRPGIDVVSKKDLGLIQRISRRLHRLRILPHLRWLDLSAEFQQLMREELDYRYEITSIRRMRRVLKRHGLYGPKGFRRYSTPRVLVMEYISGALMSDYLRCAHQDPDRVKQWCQQNNVSPEVVGNRMLESFYRQLFEEELFHGDLHPGNIILLRNNGIAFIDYGSVGRLESDFRRKYTMHIEAMCTGGYSKAIDLMLLFSLSLPPGDLSHVKSEIARRFQWWERRTRVRNLPFEGRSVQAIINEITKVLAQNGIWLNWDFLRAGRSWMMLDSSFKELMPRCNVARATRQYFKGKEKRDRRRLIRNAEERLVRLPNPLDIPQEQYNSTILQASIVLRLARVFDASASQVELLAASLARTMLALGWVLLVALVMAFLHQAGRGWALAWVPSGFESWLDDVLPLEWQVWFVLFLAVLWFQRTMFLVGRRFAEKNARVNRG